MTAGASLKEYCRSLLATHDTGKATEHSYRPALQTLIDGAELRVPQSARLAQVVLGAAASGSALVVVGVKFDARHRGSGARPHEASANKVETYLADG